MVEILKKQVSELKVDLSNYSPVNKQQAEFHASTARHKMLIGGYGGGKSYPAFHDTIFHALENDKHNSGIFRNTWDSVKDNIEKEMEEVLGGYNLIKSYNKELHNIVLINDHTLMFRPLTLKRATLKGFHFCQLFIDDPDVGKYQDTISFLFTRLRNRANGHPATRFQSIITANWEGRDWLWKTYMKNRKPGGNGIDIDENGKEHNHGFAYWVVPTTDNPTLPDNYITDLAAMHSPEWMDRYVHCKLDARIGLVYPDFNKEKHVIPREQMPTMEHMIQVIKTMDIGMTAPTAIYEMSTDGEAIYIYNEVYKKGWKSSTLGEYLSSEKGKKIFNKMIIDPSSAKGEMTSGTSVKADLKRNWRIHTEGADNNIIAGISAVSDLMMPSLGIPRIYISNDCVKLIGELDLYRWKEPSDMDFDDMTYEEKPVKKNDHGCDSIRYGVQYLKKFLKKTGDVTSMRTLMNKRDLELKRQIPYYRNHPELLEEEEMRVETNAGMARKPYGLKFSNMTKKKLEGLGCLN